MSQNTKTYEYNVSREFGSSIDFAIHKSNITMNKYIYKLDIYAPEIYSVNIIVYYKEDIMLSYNELVNKTNHISLDNTIINNLKSIKYDKIKINFNYNTHKRDNNNEPQCYIGTCEEK